jgi:hypothetical protein
MTCLNEMYTSIIYYIFVLLNINRCLSFCTFSFGHCFVCSSPIYGFWLHLWYLQTLLNIKRKKYKDNVILFIIQIRYHLHATPLTQTSLDQSDLRWTIHDYDDISFFFCQLYCLFLFNLRILITPFLSSNSSHNAYFIRALNSFANLHTGQV